MAKIKIENPLQVLSTAFVQIVDGFRLKRHPQNARPLITNVPTQLVGNMTRSFVAVWTKGKNKITVDLSEFQPARNLETGEKRKDLAGQVFSDYRFARLPANIAEREFWNVLSYFSACICKGQLPTPNKRSGSSTIMSHFVDSWIQSQGLTLDSIRIIEANGAELTYNSDQFNRILSIFVENGDNILATWEDSQRGGKKSEIDWV